MITLHLLQQLQDDDFGVIDETLFWGKMPLDVEGISIIDRGSPYTRGTRLTQAFDLYSRGSNDLTGADILEQILEWMIDNYVTCDLPEVPEHSDKTYHNCQILPLTNVENVGKDETDRVIWRLAGQISYKRERQ